jgi:hypothetical protein
MACDHAGIEIWNEFIQFLLTYGFCRRDDASVASTRGLAFSLAYLTATPHISPRHHTYTVSAQDRP